MPEEVEELRRQWDMDMERIFPWWKEPDLPEDIQEELSHMDREFQRLMREGIHDKTES